VLLARRGNCQFAVKAGHAAAAGASAIVIMDSEPAALLSMSAPHPQQGPLISELSHMAAAMIDHHSGNRILAAIESGTSSNLLVQFASDPSPANDICLPERQAALAVPPVDPSGRLPFRSLPRSVLGQGEQREQRMLAGLEEQASAPQEERSATDAFVASWKRIHERPVDPPFE